MKTDRSVRNGPAGRHIVVTVIGIALALAGTYLAVGLLFSGPFVAVGVGRVDPHAARATWGFRLLIVPGAVLLWPLLARRWLSGLREPPAERNAHRCVARPSRSPKRKLRTP